MMEMALLPADNYIVINKSVITSNDMDVLNRLYLPIIGPIAVSLYNILYNDLGSLKVMSDNLSHAHLLRNLHISNKEFVDVRSVLEGIGLLKSYLKTDSVNNYIYELYSPISSHEFFTHPIFNVVLYNNVGKTEYEKLTNYFKLPKINKDGYTEITKSFSDVFESIPCTSFDIYNDNIMKYNKLKLNINSNFDMNFLIESMPKQIDKRIFTKDLQELIISLAYLYDIDVSKMGNIIRSCINERGSVNRDELRKVARDHYQFDHSGLLPTVIERTQPEYLRKPIGDNSNIAKMIYTFETVSPYDFLRSKCGDAEPVKRDVKLLEDLIIDYKLKPGVVNVLVDYVLKTNDNKLTKSLVETIAGQWQRKKIETVEDAMEIARKNHQIRNTSSKSNKTVLKDKNVPVWFDKNNLAEVASEEERELIEDMLKEYK